MPFQSTAPVIDTATWTQLTTGMQTAVNALTDANINLTKEERQGSNNIGPERQSYVENYDAVKDDHPKVKPQYMEETDFVAHYDIFKNAIPVVSLMKQALEILEDIQINSGHFSYEYLLEVYNNAGRAKKRNVPGADTIYDMLNPLFADMGNSGTEGDLDNQ